MIVIGGYSLQNMVLGDVYILDTSSFTWVTQFTPSGSSPGNSTTTTSEVSSVTSPVVSSEVMNTTASGGTSVGPIAGGVVGGLVFLAAIGAILFWRKPWRGTPLQKPILPMGETPTGSRIQLPPPLPPPPPPPFSPQLYPLTPQFQEQNLPYVHIPPQVQEQQHLPLPYLQIPPQVHSSKPDEARAEGDSPVYNGFKPDEGTDDTPFREVGTSSNKPDAFDASK